MDFKEYQRKAYSTAIYPDEFSIIYPALGLCGEVGEVAEKIKKIIRDDAIGQLQDKELCKENRGISNTVKSMITKEMGDVLWYLAALATDLGVDLGEVAEENIKKLASRKERGKIGGSGDDR